jgi:threonine dehydrogenase-like Zn-dependent dehydrogenase
MKAWRVYGPKDIRLDEVPYPAVKPGWVVLKIRTVQVSVTEAQHLYGDLLTGEEWVKRFKEEGSLPMFGHEFCGEVVELGEGVKNLEIGDRVFWGMKIPCHKCDNCRAGHEEHCSSPQLIGLHMPGVLSEYATLPAQCLAKMQNATDSEITAMQPLTASLGSVLAADIAIGDAVAVFGMGVMGLTSAQLSRFAGASTIIGVDIRDQSLELGKQLGVDILINSGKRDPIQGIKEATEGLGADVVFECAGGSPQFGLSGNKTLAQATSAARPGGRMVLASIPGPDAVLEVEPLRWHRIEYRSDRSYTRKELDWAIHLVETKRVQLAPLVTHVLEGIEKVPEAFEITVNKSKYGALSPAQVVISH